MTKGHLDFRGLLILLCLTIFIFDHVPRSAAGKIEKPKLREKHGKAIG
jgi:hypothetical protein